MSQRPAGTRRGRRIARRQAGRKLAAASAGDLVSETLASLGLTEQIRGLRVVAEWEELVGERIARRAQPEGVVRRVLVVRVVSSAWMHELGLLKRQLLESLWKATGEPRLFDDISFQLAGRTRAPADRPGRPPPRRPKRPPPRPAPIVAPAERERILTETQAVDDPELRELIARVRTRHGR